MEAGVGADARVAEGVAAAAPEVEADGLAGVERGGDVRGGDAVELEVLARRQVDVAAAVGAQEGGGVAEVVRRDAPAHAPDAHHRAVIALLVDAEAGGTALERLGVDTAGDVVRPRGDERFLEILHDRSFLLHVGANVLKLYHFPPQRVTRSSTRRRRFQRPRANRTMQVVAQIPQ